MRRGMLVTPDWDDVMLLAVLRKAARLSGPERGNHGLPLSIC